MKLYSKKLYTYIYLNYLIKFIIYLSKETWNFFFFFNRKKKKIELLIITIYLDSAYYK